MGRPDDTEGEVLDVRGAPPPETRKYGVQLEPMPVEPDGEEMPIPLRPSTIGSYGYDLALAQDTLWEWDEVKIAGCGFRLAHDLPHNPDEGLSLLVLPRGSTFLKHGLIVTNSPGLVDADYTGEVSMILWRPRRMVLGQAGWVNQEPTTLTLPRGTRLAQMLFVPVALPLIYRGSSANRPERGGFGSTGER